MTQGSVVPSSMFGFQENNTIVSYLPKNAINVFLFSTLHQDDQIEEREEKLPELISFYNNKKRGVETLDELSVYYSVSRNSRRWPLTIFFSLLNAAGTDNI